MFVTELSLTDFRNYTTASLQLSRGVNVFVGSNGQGKTNLVEAVEYLSTMTSHRVASTAPLIRAGCDSAILRAKVQASGDDPRVISVEMEVAHGRANVARLNRAPLRPREMVGALRTVVFSPVDLAIVRGDPADRRGWLDSLVVTRWPRMAGVRQDLDKVLKQRNALLKSMAGRSMRSSGDDAETTLAAWDEQLAAVGAELLHARLDTLADVLPHVQRAYETIAPVNNQVLATYKTGLDLDGVVGSNDVRATLVERLLASMEARRSDELVRGVTLVGPQRDDVELFVGDLPAKGYASHGECWSFALSLRLGGFALVRDDGTEPVLVLDDVFAELDTSRRDRLAGAIVDAEQVLITAAVGADVPDFPTERRFRVDAGTVWEEVKADD